MPILKNALKKMRSDATKTAFNQGQRTELKTVLAKAKKHADSTHLSEAFSTLDKAAKKNLIHKNKAARIKSRLSKLVKIEVVKPAEKVAKKATPKVSKTKK
jgi:small subunit ribosomal protein S20